jgi:hypothetical protein
MIFPCDRNEQYINAAGSKISCPSRILTVGDTSAASLRVESSADDPVAMHNEDSPLKQGSTRE